MIFGFLIVRFPRLYVAASLKLANNPPPLSFFFRRFPRLYVAASLKHGARTGLIACPMNVFRGFMSRPH